MLTRQAQGGAWLWSARLKLLRAVEHLVSLDAEVRSFSRAERDRLLHDGDAEMPEYFVPSWSATPAPEGWPGQHGVELPHRFGVVIGDLLGNLRSALDHAVNGLAGDKAGQYTKFPIYTSSRKFKGGAKGDLEGVPRPLWTEFERMQPYHRHARGKRLLLLANLCNADKHRVLHITSALLDQSARPSGFVGEVMFRDFGVLGDHAEVRITFSKDKAEPKVEGHASYQILLAQVAGGKMLATRLDLQILIDEVGGIVAEIGDMLPPA